MERSITLRFPMIPSLSREDEPLLRRCLGLSTAIITDGSRNREKCYTLQFFCYNLKHELEECKKLLQAKDRNLRSGDADDISRCGGGPRADPVQSPPCSGHPSGLSHCCCFGCKIVRVLLTTSEQTLNKRGPPLPSPPAPSPCPNLLPGHQKASVFIVAITHIGPAP
ncbi:unnamed protein product [Pleuronectes platessa]|uniref:Uncharacterized protein n=1 Tax=Pleuronectes platessa TaxID=8262 RepID=A0A9N7VQ98_PLEPL|nr:unnamed protein product [Pleuronectes platessa]